MSSECTNGTETEQAVSSRIAEPHPVRLMVSLTEAEAAQLDRVVAECGYRGKADAVRTIVRKYFGW